MRRRFTLVVFGYGFVAVFIENKRLSLTHERMRGTSLERKLHTNEAGL
jgi:hypothetical protein